MDADLQHPPELIGALVDEAASSNADVVVASRYCSRGDVGELSAFRLALSRGSVTAAKLLFPRRLRRISDPMSGFFLIRRSAIDVKALQPKGFKMLLEIVLAGRRLSTSEVPFRFGERHAGVSKACVREGVRYIRRLLEIRVGDRCWAPLSFGMAASLKFGMWDAGGDKRHNDKRWFVEGEPSRSSSGRRSNSAQPAPFGADQERRDEGGRCGGRSLGGFGPWEEGREASVYDALRASPWLGIVRISRRGIHAA